MKLMKLKEIGVNSTNYSQPHTLTYGRKGWSLTRLVPVLAALLILRTPVLQFVPAGGRCFGNGVSANRFERHQLRRIFLRVGRRCFRSPGSPRRIRRMGGYRKRCVEQSCFHRHLE